MATTAAWHRPQQQRNHRPPPSNPERTLPPLRVGIDWSTPTSTAQNGPAEPTPEQQLAEQLRFVRAGYDAGKAKQPLYRPAVLRRTDTTHLPSSALNSGIISPPSAHPQSTSGTATPIAPGSAVLSSAPGSPSGGSHDAILDVPHRRGSLASSSVVSYPSGPIDDLSAWGRHDLSRRCGTEWVGDKLVGRMMEKADWTPDSFRNFCAADRCPKRFGIFDRKHHCRLCGEVFCASCSSSRIDLLPPARQRCALVSSFADQLPLSAPPAPVTPSPGSGPTVLSSSVADLSIVRPPVSASAATMTTTTTELDLTPCRVCDLCASSLALNIDPLATRARKPLLESATATTSLTPPDSRASITPPLQLHHHHYPQRTTSPGSPGRLRNPGARTLSSSDPNVRDASSSNGSAGSSRYSGSTVSTATTSPSSSAAPPTISTSATRHHQPPKQQHLQAFYHPFPNGADSAELFSSPVEADGVVGGRPKAGKKGGEVIPEHVHFGQVWHQHDGLRREAGGGRGDGSDYSDSEGDPGEVLDEVAFDDLGMMRPRRRSAAGRNKLRVVLAGGGGHGRRSANDEDEDGQAAFSYQWSTF